MKSSGVLTSERMFVCCWRHTLQPHPHHLTEPPAQCCHRVHHEGVRKSPLLQTGPHWCWEAASLPPHSHSLPVRLRRSEPGWDGQSSDHWLHEKIEDLQEKFKCHEIRPNWELNIAKLIFLHYSYNVCIIKYKLIHKDKQFIINQDHERAKSVMGYVQCSAVASQAKK